MNAQEEMQKIVEAADECWHNHDVPSGNKRFNCEKCGLGEYDPKYKNNPSPTDLNELFRLAEKLQLVAVAVTDPITGSWAQARQLDGLMLHKFNADTPSDAFRTALVKAIEAGELLKEY
jgi:hypothetical protein